MTGAFAYRCIHAFWTSFAFGIVLAAVVANVAFDAVTYVERLLARRTSFVGQCDALCF
jgi:hypothetical protein